MRRTGRTAEPSGVSRLAGKRAARATSAPTDQPTQAYEVPRRRAAAPAGAAPGAPGVRTAYVGRAAAPTSKSKARDARQRRLVKRVDVWSVLKVSLAFYLCVLVVVLVAGAVLWDVAESAGLIAKIDKLVRSLFALKTFQLHPLTALLWGGAFVASLCLLGVLVNVIAAVLYNLLSGIVGGVKVVVAGDEDGRAASLEG